jgi:guanosine-3',5'-bis(diphosphate) 3'-pyrophosphohydrolase
LQAVSFAAARHRSQKRKDGDRSPYINHPIQVALCLAEQGVADPVTLIAAVLHDTIEDTETKGEELEERFGPEVRAVVEEVTDDKSLRKEVRKKLQVEHAPSLSERAKLVKLADKIANVGDVTHAPPVDWSLERRWEYLDWTERVVEGCRGVHAGLEAQYDEVLSEARENLNSG